MGTFILRKVEIETQEGLYENWIQNGVYKQLSYFEKVSILLFSERQTSVEDHSDWKQE